MGRCHSTTSKKVLSSITVRDFSISSAFMLLWITTATGVVNQNNARLTNTPMKMLALRGSIATVIDVSPGLQRDVLR